MSSLDILSSHLQKRDLIDLGVGSLPTRFSPKELELAAFQMDISSAYMYGPHQGNESLRALVAQEQGVPPEWVIITNGASEAISLIYLALKSNKEGVLIPSIHFPTYREFAANLGLKIAYYAIGEFEEISSLEIVPYISKNTALVVINSPLNPSGTVISPENFYKILSAKESKSCFVLLDKTYDFLLWDNFYKLSTSQSIFKNYPNLIVLGSLSKRLGLAGLRVGYLIVSNSDLRNKLLELKMHLSMCTSVVSQNLGEYLLGLLTPERELYYSNSIRSRCKMIYEQLTNQGFYTFFPKGGPFLVCEFPGIADTSNFLKKAGILSLPLTVFGGLNSKARLCYARDSNIIGEAVKKLAML